MVIASTVIHLRAVWGLSLPNAAANPKALAPSLQITTIASTTYTASLNQQQALSTLHHSLPSISTALRSKHAPFGAFMGTATLSSSHLCRTNGRSLFPRHATPLRLTTTLRHAAPLEKTLPRTHLLIAPTSAASAGQPPPVPKSKLKLPRSTLQP